MLRAFFIAFFVVIVALVGWHLLFPILAGAITLTAGIWAFVIASIVIYCLSILLVFLLTGFGVVFLAVFAAIWFGISIALFPFMFPILIPLLVTLLFISYIRRKSN